MDNRTFLLLLTPLFLIAYPTGWSEDILLSPSDIKERSDPVLGIDNMNNIWVAWDTSNWTHGVSEILFTKYDTLGNCFIPESAVSNNASYSIIPEIAIDNNTIQITWLDETPLGIGIWHAKLAEDGSYIIPPHIAASGSNDLYPFRMVINRYKEINIIWDELVASCNQMNYTKLDSIGDPIISKMKVSLPNIIAYSGGIGVDSFGNVHLAYRSDSGTSDRLTYTKLDRLGNFLINNKLIGYGVSPTIIPDHSQNIHIVFSSMNPNNIVRYIKINQNGDVVIGPKNISIGNYNDVPHMAMDSLQYLHVVWGDCSSLDSCGIFYTKLDTLGNYIIPPGKIVYRPYCYYPWHSRIAVDQSNKLNIVWSDQRLYPTLSAHIFYKRGENNQSIGEVGIKQPITSDLYCSPNPFRHLLNINFSKYKVNKNIKIEIFDASGRKVKNLLPDILSGFMTWNGKDDNYHILPNGIYFISIITDKTNEIKPVIYLR